MEDITVSVIVPVYNVAEYLHRCVNSILGQTYTQFELILVDDGSLDGSGKICDEYAENDSRVLVIHKKNGGLSSARNAGIEAARGAYFLFVDSDDYIREESLCRLLNEVQFEGADLVICGYERRTQSKSAEFIGVNRAEKKICCDSKTAMKMLVSQRFDFVIPAWNKLYKRELFASLRYPEGKLHEDEFVIHHILYAAKKIVIIPDVLYEYMIGGTTITSVAYNPARLDAIEACLARASFFEEHGCKAFYDAEINHVYDCVRNALGRIQEYDRFASRLDEFRQELKSGVYRRVFGRGISLRTKVVAVLFNYGPKAFWSLLKLWEKRK